MELIAEIKEDDFRINGGAPAPALAKTHLA